MQLTYTVGVYLLLDLENTKVAAKMYKKRNWLTLKGAGGRRKIRGRCLHVADGDESVAVCLPSVVVVCR